MADNIEHLMPEQFRRVREDIRQLSDAVTYRHNQQMSDRLVLRSMQVSLDSANELLTSLTARTVRIERRLELSDDAAPAGFAEGRHPFEPQPKR